MNWLYLLCLISLYCVSESIDSDPYEWCMTGRHHKKKPDNQTDLIGQCAQWKQYSCCTRQTSESSSAQLNHYRFNYDHCQTMSDRCKRHFVQDLCFYECEPYLKPWIVKTNRSYAKERMLNVPLCASDCHQWWNDCSDDYTCAINWQKGFNWTTGTNVCKSDKCQKFKELYDTPKDFCEKVWDYSWKYTEDSSPCMKLWFNGSEENPNKRVAKLYSEKTTGNSGNEPQKQYTYMLSLSFLFTYLFL